MKYNLSVFALGLLALIVRTQALSAQSENQPVVEPQYNDVFYRLDAGKLAPLERVVPAYRAKAGGFIAVNVKTFVSYPGKASPVRFRSGDKLNFVVRSMMVASPATDPASLFGLRALEAKKSAREVATTTTHAGPIHGATTTNNATVDLIPLNFERYGSYSYKITVPPLAPGEYAFSGLPAAAAAFCFGVDK